MPLAFPRTALRALAALLLALGAPALAAQVRLVDEGSFAVTLAGTRIGREDFSIRSTPGAAGDTVLIAQGTVVRDDRRLSPALSAGRDAAARSYQVEVRRRDTVTARWSAQVAGGRMSVRVQTPTSEAAREWLVADGAPVVDLEVVHQFHFLGRSGRTGVVPVIVPRRYTQERWQVAEAGTDTIPIGGRALVARRLAIVDGQGEPVTLWLDGAHRVLRVEYPRRQLVAEREEAPR